MPTPALLQRLKERKLVQWARLVARARQGQEGWSEASKKGRQERNVEIAPAGLAIIVIPVFMDRRRRCLKLKNETRKSSAVTGT